MKVAVYGISKSGKDYLLEHLVKLLNGIAIHVKGSQSLRAISEKSYGISFHSLTSDQQNHVRSLFIEELKNYEKQYRVVFVDGHYSFPSSGNEFKIAFTESDMLAYDVFFYLNRTANRIKLNAETTPTHQYYSVLIDEEKTIAWMEFDRNGLKMECNKTGIDLIVLDDNFDENIAFLVDYIENYYEYSSKSILDKIMTSLAPKITSSKTVILVDCDKTISVNDITVDYLNEGQLDINIVKTIFKGDFYSSYQFYRFHKYLHTVSNLNHIVQMATQRIIPNNNLIDDMKQMPNETYIVGITTGIADAWADWNQSNPLFDFLIGKCVCKSISDLNIFVTPSIKEQLAKELRKLGYFVIAIGDSIIDMGMIQNADKGILVASTKIDKRILDYMKNIENSKIAQPVYNNVKYPNVEEVSSIWHTH